MIYNTLKLIGPAQTVVLIALSSFTSSCLSQAPTQPPSSASPASSARQNPGRTQAPPPPWMNIKLNTEERVDMVLKQMTLDEKIALLHGNGMANSGIWEMPLTYLGNGGAGYVEGVPRLKIPPIFMSDAAYGVRGSGQNGRYSTAMPSTLGAASSWDANAACEYGALIGRELRDQGYNMTLGGGVNLTRDPRNGRSFEYAGEDPLLAGTVVGNLMKCEQAEHVIGDIKHYALNDQETGRNIVNVTASRRAMQETDLLAFHIAIDLAKPGAVMCSYNRVNGAYACENPYLLHDVLKGEWKFPGFVLSDWGGTHSTVNAITAGLDQEQPLADYFGPKLKDAVETSKVPQSAIDDAARRVLYAEFVSGVVDNPVAKGVPDIAGGLDIAQKIEEQSIVLLKNQGAILPLSSAVHSIVLIGGHADVGMLSGGGSAQVDPPGGNAIMPPGKGATRWQDHVWFPTSPLTAIKTLLPGVKVTFDDGKDLEATAKLAKAADVAIVFAYQWTSEGMDLPTLTLPDNQDALIDKVASVNSRTIVVLENGTAMTMPWADRVAGIVEAWYAGSSGHKALANILTGRVNPSAKLPMTFPRSEDDLPRKTIAALSAEDRGQGRAAVNGEARPASKYAVSYDDDGTQVGYKWYEAQHKPVLYPFGFGLSYTTYTYSGLTVGGDGQQKTATFTVRNTGKRAGTEIAQVYVTLPDASGEPYKRLAGWQRVSLNPNETKTVTVPIDARVLSIFQEDTSTWRMLPGTYTVVAGSSSAQTPLKGQFQME